MVWLFFQKGVTICKCRKSFLVRLFFQKGVAIYRCRKSFLVGKWCGYPFKKVWLSVGVEKVSGGKMVWLSGENGVAIWWWWGK